MKRIISFLMAFVVIVAFNFTQTSTVHAASARQMENLDRGLVAVKVNNGVFISWRLLGTEAVNIGFNLYRDGTKVNSTPITSSTNYLDANGTNNSKYFVRAVVNGAEQPKCETISVLQNNYLSINLQKPAGGKTPDGVSYDYSANDASVGDVDGDGEYEIILKWDPSNSKDNSQAGYTGNVFIDAYKLNGTKLWRIDLGKNIRAGAHYTQFMVYDLDGDGKAEIACKTSDGTVDGTGKVIGNSSADYRNSRGQILTGSEYLTVFQGSTGKALTSINYEPARGKVADWGDNYGNRSDRYLACIAYLDGVHPSLVMGRGYYTRLTMVAYNWNGTSLSKLWDFDSNDSGNASYKGQGNHNLSVADADSDGKDEIIYGACAIDDNGKGMYTTGWGHGDAMHVGDLDPNRPGLEVFSVHEDKPSIELHDAKTGKSIWSKTQASDDGRGLCADIDPTHPGDEMWSIGEYALYDAAGNKISSNRPSINFAIWWDGDLSRELLDNTNISKWDYKAGRANTVFTATGCSSNNTTKATPCLQADLFGDWREEVIYKTEDSSALHIYTTTAVTDKRIYTLMHDSVYRLGVAWQNVAYNQPPHTSFFLGNGMGTVTKPNIYVTKSSAQTPADETKVENGSYYRIKNVNSGKYLSVPTDDSGAKLVQTANTASTNSLWKVAYVDADHVKLISQVGSASRVIDVPGGSTSDGVQLQIWGSAANGAAYQQFKLKNNGDGTFGILTEISGDTKGFDVLKYSKDEGAQVIQYTYGASSNQKWIFEKVK